MKATRHALILQAIEENEIDTQEQLAEALKTMGVKVTQATISRDIKELRLSKVMTSHGTSKYSTIHKRDTEKNERLTRIFSESVQSIAAADNLIVIKTLPASAAAAAEMIDSLEYPEIVGSLAGDNTIFVAVQSREKVPSVMQRFQDMIKKY